MKLLWTSLILCVTLFAQSSDHTALDTKTDNSTIQTLIKSCNAADMKACNDLGIAYSKGYGVERDQVKATKFYAKACVSNNMDGCYNLAIARSTGKGVMKNSKKAAELFKKACDGGHQKACESL